MEGDCADVYNGARLRISTHALRMEGDLTREEAETALENFYPRPPHGGRRS